MTATLPDVHPTVRTDDSRAPWWVVVGASAAAGFALGVLARVWMRVISDNPEFSWSGTQFIVGAFVVFALTQAISLLGRRRRHRWSTALLRIVGAVGLVPLFTGAGGFMLPTVVLGGIVVHHPPRRRWPRAVLGLLAAVPFVLVARDVREAHGIGLRLVVGSAAMALTYAAVIAMAKPTFAPNPSGLRVPKVLLVLGWVVLVGLVLMFTVGVATSG